MDYQQAVKISRIFARKYPQAYMSSFDDFEPHEWVVQAIIYAHDKAHRYGPWDWMKDLAAVIVMILLGVPWMAGLVLAKGFWSTVFALFPPYAYYLVVEYVMKGLKWV